MSDSSRSSETGAGAVVVPDEQVMLVRHHAGVAFDTACTVHRVPVPDRWDAAAVGTLCGALLILDEIEIVEPGVGVPCTSCVVNQASATAARQAPVGDLATADDRLVDWITYHAWGWPVARHRDQIRLQMHRDDASAIAIPITFATEVTQILAKLHCAPAVMVNPCAPAHGIVLTGERFATGLPWPAGVHRVIGTLVLPPTMTFRGPITWIQPPQKDSLRLSREIDVFGALRDVLSHSPEGGSSASGT